MGSATTSSCLFCQMSKHTLVEAGRVRKYDYVAVKLISNSYQSVPENSQLLVDVLQRWSTL